VSAIGAPALRVCNGPRACEETLLADLAVALSAPLEERLSRPVLIVVPSRSLRAHLQLRIAARLGPSVLGLTCRTLSHVAIDLVERAEGSRPINDGLIQLLARRFARSAPVLRRSFDALEDGYRTVGGTVRDLLEAGLEQALVDGLVDEIAASGRSLASRAQIERARALTEVAALAGLEMERLGVAGTPFLLRRAAEIVRSGVDELPAVSHLAISGFADATGMATDLLEALLARYRGTLYLDRPPDPALRERDDSGNSFSRRFEERILAVTGAPSALAKAAEAPQIEMFRTVGAASEAREVARRVRSLLALGVTPEEIGVVARRIEPYRFALREELDTLAVPFSGFGTLGPVGPDGRRCHALIELLARRERTPIDRWLELRQSRGSSAGQVLLRQALLCLGAGRLGEVASLAFEPLLDRNGSYPLPVRRGFDAFDGGDDEAPARVLARRSSVTGASLEAARSSARNLLRRLGKLTAAATLEEIETEARDLVIRDLAWRDDACRPFEVAMETAGRGLAAGWPIALDEWLDLFAPATEAVTSRPLGGEGGGVQILDVIEARGRTFGYLFVMGLNRGVFPRVVLEDPLLPDPLRQALARSGFGLLPDLPRKSDGHAEERYLFAQLLDSAPHITLSWQEADEDGARLTPSPLVERLRWRTQPEAPEAWREPPRAPHRFSLAAVEQTPRPPRDAAILAGLHGTRDRFAELLPLALEEGGCAPPIALTVAAARRRLLDEIDPDLRTPAGRSTRSRLGPHFGWLGPAGAGDPRESGNGEISVTTLEGLARCPWQAFLTKILRLEPAADPLELLPAIEGRLVGSLVHDVLEAIARCGAGDPAGLEEALARLPFGAPWPPTEELERLVAHSAARLVAREGIALTGFDRALAAVVGRHLEEARKLDWAAEASPDVVAAEFWGAVRCGEPQSALRRLRFRADRVDRLGPGAAAGLRFTDYKTGRRPLAERAGKLNEALRDAVRSGDALQVAAYALSRGTETDRGRYVYLHPELQGSDPPREAEVRADDREIRRLFEQSVTTLVSAWDRGVFFPRLVHADRDKEPERCSFCAVAEACLRGDSGARGRLRDWADEQLESGSSDADEVTWLATWRLDAAPTKGGKG
jgi:RecB family exonuclease